MNILKINCNVFDSIKHVDEYGYEYWSARELSKVLEYSEYRKFLPAIKKAMISCKSSFQNINDHFAQSDGMINLGKGGKRKERITKSKIKYYKYLVFITYSYN